MKTKLLFFLLICLIVNLIQSCKNEDEKVIDQKEVNFFLQVIFMPSFHRGCIVEISAIDNKTTLQITPLHIGDFRDQMFFPAFLTQISNEDYYNFRTTIKDLDLKSIKNDDGIPIDGITVSCLYSNLLQYNHQFNFSNSKDDSPYTLLAETVLELCMKYVNFDPTAKAIEDVYGYYNKSFGMRKVNEYQNYYRFYNGAGSSDTSNDYSEFFMKLPKNQRVIFDMSNLNYFSYNFRENFNKYAKSNQNIIFLLEDYDKYFCDTQSNSYKNHLGKILTGNYVKDGNLFFDNRKLLKVIDPGFKIKYLDTLILNKNCDDFFQLTPP